MADNTSNSPPAHQRSAVIGPVVAVGIVLLIVIALAFSGMGPSGGTAEDPAADARPVGAGTNPDGIADENIEGLGNETGTSDFVESSAAAESAAAESTLDAPQATDAENLAPLGDDTPVVEEIPGDQTSSD